MRLAQVLEISEFKLHKVLVTLHDTELSFRINRNISKCFCLCLLNNVSVIVPCFFCIHFNQTVLINCVALHLKFNLV
jgi:hypothetical protein